MTVSEKIKTIDNKIEQNKALYYLDRQTAKISALLPGNVCKYEDEDVLPEKELLKKAAKGFENFPLVSELKKQTDIIGKQY